MRSTVWILVIIIENKMRRDSMEKNQSQKNVSAKIWWSLALFINVILTVLVVFTKNIPGCIAVIAFGLYLSKYGDPVIFKNYNQRRKEKYEAFEKMRKKRKGNEKL